MRYIKWWHCPWPLVPPNHPKLPHFLYFAPPFIALQRVNLETSDLVHWFTIASPTCQWKIFLERSVVRVSWPFLEFYTPCKISATANARDFKFCTRVDHAKSLSCDEWVFPKWAWSESREQFLHCGLRKFRHRKSSVYRWYPQLDCRRFVCDTYRTTKATRSRRGWVHMFITHCVTVML